MLHRLMFVLTGLVLIGVGAPAHATTLEEAIKQLVEAHARVQSYSATVKSRESLDFGDGNTLQSTVTGRVEWMRKDDKILFRSDAESSSIQKFKGLETPTSATTTMIFDGEYFYTIQNIMGELHASKQNPNPMLAANAETVLHRLKDDHGLSLLGEETWQDAPCYVVVAVPKEPDKTRHMARAHYYFRKDTGTAVRTLGFDAEGNVVYSIDHFDVKRNPTVDPERFVFAMPEGAKFTDFVNP